MTTLTERPTYVGTRRFADRPLGVTRARHRLAEPALVELAASLADALRAAGRAAAGGLTLAWAARMTARTAGVLIIAGAILLGGGTLVILEVTAAPADLVHPVLVVTPSPTPYPDGWTYEGG